MFNSYHNCRIRRDYTALVLGKTCHNSSSRLWTFAHRSSHICTWSRIQPGMGHDERQSGMSTKLLSYLYLLLTLYRDTPSPPKNRRVSFRHQLRPQSSGEPVQRQLSASPTPFPKDWSAHEVFFDDKDPWSRVAVTWPLSWRS